MTLGTQSPEPGRLPAKSSPNKTAGRAYAENAAKLILASYPDYGKTPPEYLVVMTNLLASYPQTIIDRIANPRYGIASRTKFLPTVADVTEMANELIDRAAVMSRPTPQLSRTLPFRAEFRPFPRLWEAFSGDPEAMHALESHLPFETVDQAAYALATKGVMAARDVLLPSRHNEGGTDEVAKSQS